MTEDRRPVYVGRIERDAATGEIKGSIREVMSGWSLDIVLTKATSGAGYDVHAYLPVKKSGASA